MDSYNCIQFITTRRGKTAVLFRGYRYYNVRALGHKIYWRCCTRSCSATLVTADGILTKVGDDHNHLSDIPLSSPQDDLEVVNRVLQEQSVKSLFMIKQEKPESMSPTFDNCNANKLSQSDVPVIQCSSESETLQRRKSCESSMQISRDGANRFRRDVALKLEDIVRKDTVSGKVMSTCLSLCSREKQTRSSVSSRDSQFVSQSQNSVSTNTISTGNSEEDVIIEGISQVRRSTRDRTVASLFTSQNAVFSASRNTAQQLRHGNLQMGSRGGMASRPQHHPQSQQRMAAPSSTVTSSAPPLKRPRLDPPRPMVQTASSRQMGQAPVQRQNMGGFNQSHGQMPAPRNAIGSPTRLMGQSPPPRPVGRPMQPRQMSRSPQAQVMRPSSQQMNTNINRQTKSDSLERAFLNPDHSSHIMTELSALWKSGKFVDAAILVGGMKLQAHRMVLFAASPYLRASFDHLNPTTELRLKMPSDIKLDIVFQFLTYIYDGVLKLNPSNVVSLLKISLMLQMEHLTACCREYMAQAVKTGAMPRLREQDVEAPLLVLMDQKPPDSGQMKTDMCTQTVSDSNRSQPRFQSNPRVDFERVFGEENIRTSDQSRNQSNQNVQSDIDLYRDYGSDSFRQDDDDDAGGGQGGRGMQTTDDTDDADATPMMIIKNEFIDPEYELSLNTQHETSPAADCDNVSNSSNQTEDRLERAINVHSDSTSDVPDTGAPGGSESMQVVPGMDLDASSHSSSDMPDHALDQSTNDTVDQPTLNISTYDSLQQCDDSPSVPHPESNLAPSLDPSITSLDESSFAETQDQPYTRNRTSSDKHGESSTTVDSSLTFEPSDPDQSVVMEGSGDEATPQFGTEQFLSSDFDVQPTKSEPKDPM